MTRTGEIKFADFFIRGADMQNLSKLAYFRRTLLSNTMQANRFVFALLGLGLATAATPAFADASLPTGGSVVAGAASITSGANATTISQTSARAVVNWDGFSVGQGSSVGFVQPDARSATLNRVTGTTTSQIAGQITSNGAVYLVNPNGIAITASGAVNTAGGFVASTLDIANGDFMAGRLNFVGNGASGSVSNAGHITASQGAYVALLGGSVSNSGFITVPLGRVGLGSGESIALDLNGGGFMQVAVPTNLLTGSNALINNAGSISASGGTVLLKAASVKAAVRNIVNMSGNINADSATSNGGTITLLGGEGGTVTVNGTLSARATGTTGSGGVIETSGYHTKLNGISVSTSAANGKTGKWIIDPVDFTVAAVGGDITGAQLGTNLNSTTVFIDSNSGSLGTNGDVNFNDNVSWTSGNALFVDASRNVNINANLDNNAGAFISLTADSTGNGNGTVIFAPGKSISTVNSVVNVFYNPTSYATPTDYSANILGGFVYDYILVNNVNDLQAINTNLNGKYGLVHNINASATAGWNGGLGFVPLGTDSTGGILNAGLGFAGTFYAQSQSITGLTINRPLISNVGLFGYSSGNIAAVNLVNGNVTGASNVGGLVGYQGTNFNPLWGNGGVNRSSYSGTVNGQNNVGGVIGFSTADLDQVFALGATVTGTNGVGGIIGTQLAGIVSFAAVDPTTSVTGGPNVGGIVGVLGDGTIVAADSRATVSGTNGTGGVIFL
jgi:filamentous hemagglutinin family protein